MFATANVKECELHHLEKKHIITETLRDVQKCFLSQTPSYITITETALLHFGCNLEKYK